MMSILDAFSSRTSAALVVLNLCCWGAWFSLTKPFADVECARLSAQRQEQDLSEASPAASGFFGGERLLFSRPVRFVGTTPVYFKALAFANALPLVGSWSFVVPSPSRALGPTCSESRVCGVLFLVLSALQWSVVGGALSAARGGVSKRVNAHLC